MQRVVVLKLPTAPRLECLQTTKGYQEACNQVSKSIQQGERPNAVHLHHTHYATLRETLPSQMAQNVLHTVVGAYKSWKSNGFKGDPPIFRRPIANYSHERDWSLKPGEEVSFRLLNKRIRIPYKTGEIGHERLQTARLTDGLGGARLIQKKGTWYLEISVKLPTPRPYTPTTTVGVDIGINTLAVARAPKTPPLVIRGGHIRKKRNDAHHQRRRLQAKGTRSTRRVLQHASGREKRFSRNECRIAARDIVHHAKTIHAAIHLERLTGIRLNAKARGKSNRRRLHSWAFRTLQSCIALKAEAEGIPVHWVPPAYTSQACPACHYTARGNRSGAWFKCGSCGYQNQADVVGATNIAINRAGAMAARARVPFNGPDERGLEAEGMFSQEAEPTFKPLSSDMG